MAERTVTDTAGRAWTCSAADLGSAPSDAAQGRDVVLSCATATVDAPVSVTVGWQWEAMSSNGLARLINQVSPAPRR